MWPFRRRGMWALSGAVASFLAGEFQYGNIILHYCTPGMVFHVVFRQSNKTKNLVIFSGQMLATKNHLTL